MNARELIDEGSCRPACLLAATSPVRCSCPCGGVWHAALSAADITGMVEARTAGLQRLSDLQIVGIVA